jgi:hypothetical protein
MKFKKVVLLSYYFPPNTGVGGRRWVKFCKYLSKQNTGITVFTPEKFVLNNQPSWLSDTTQIRNLDVIEVRDRYPKILLGVPVSITGKIFYRLAKVYVSLFTRGNKYDPSSFWNPILQKDIKDHINKNNIKNLVVTGIPFNFFYHAAKLKTVIPELNLILDFRFMD